MHISVLLLTANNFVTVSAPVIMDPAKMPEGYPAPAYQPGFGTEMAPVAQPPQTLTQQPPSTHTTTVVINQELPRMNAPLRGWSSGVCAMCNDMTVCMCVFCCTSCALCSLASDLGEFPCLFMCVPNALTAVRANLRGRLGIQGSICDDCCTVCWCTPCVTCQLMREVKHAKASGQL